jgi:hypothetical protein
MYTIYMDQDNRDQIPKSEGPESQTGKMISEQNAIEGQRKEVNVESYSGVAKLGQLLKDLDFPAQKSKILQFLRQSEDFKNKGDILKALNSLEQKLYYSVSDITTAAGLVYK